MHHARTWDPLDLLGCRIRISQDENDGVASQKHFTDVSVFVDWLSLLFAWNHSKTDERKLTKKSRSFITFSRPRHFGPHFLDSLQNHIAMAVKSLHSSQEFFVVSAIDEDLSVVLDGLSQNWKRSSVEFLFFPLVQFLRSHFWLGLVHQRCRHDRSLTLVA